MSNVLITGITGFVGRKLAKKLQEKGYKVFGLVRYVSDRDLRLLNADFPDVTLLNGSLCSFHSVRAILKSADPDFVFHLAAMSPVRHSFEHPFEYEEVNFRGSMNVIHAFLKLPNHNKRRLLVASTAEVYGVQNEVPFVEDLPLNPTSPYAVTKAAMDMYCRMASLVYDLNCVVLRPTNSYGRENQTGFLMEYLISSMLRGNDVFIGAPDSIRDYIHISDHVNGYLCAMEKGKAGNAYNLGSGIGISNKDLVAKIADKTKFEGKIIFGKYPNGYPYRPLVSDQPYLVLNSSKINKDSGWVPTLNLDRGLEELICYWRSQLQFQ